MENNDFDIFEFVKLLFQQKVKVLIFTLIFTLVIFAVLFMMPPKYSINFMASSTVLKQNEVVLKLEQLKNLIENNADEKLAEVLGVSLNEAQSIAYIDIIPVKNSNDLVQVEMKTSVRDLASAFIEKIIYFMERDPQLKEREALKLEQLSYGLNKLNQELDSLQHIDGGAGVYIINDQQNMVELLDKKSRLETDLLLFDLFYVYDGYEVIKHETGWLMMIISSILAGFALALMTVLGLHFIRAINQVV